MSERDSNPLLSVRAVSPHRERWDKIGRLYRRPGFVLPNDYQSLPVLRNLIQEGSLVPSITNVIGVLGKPYLTDWAAKMVANEGVKFAIRWADKVQERPEDAFRYLKDMPYRYVNHWGAQGTRIHYACELLSNGEDISHLTLTEYETACVNQFRQWLNDFQPTFLRTEVTGFGTTTRGLGYAGTGDFNIQVNGVNILGDIKCTTDDTLILLRDGSQKQAKDIKVGDEVVTWSEEDGLRYDSISAVEDNGDQEVYTVVTEIGQSLTVTGNHPFLTRSEGGMSWKPAEELEREDKVYTTTGWTRGTGRTEEEWPYNKHLSPWLFGVLWSLAHHNATEWNLQQTVAHPKSSRKELFDELDSVGFLRTVDGTKIRVKTGLRRVAHKARIPVEDLLSKVNSDQIPDFVFKAPAIAQMAFLLGVQEVFGNKNINGSHFFVEHRAIASLRSLQQLYMNAGSVTKMGVNPQSNLPVLRVDYQSIQQFQTYGIEEVRVIKVTKHEKPEHTIAIEVSNTHNHITNGIITHNTNRTGLHADIALQLAANRNVTEITPEGETLTEPDRVDMTAGLHLSPEGYLFKEVDSSDDVYSVFESLRDTWQYHALETVGDDSRSVFGQVLTPNTINPDNNA